MGIRRYLEKCDKCKREECVKKKCIAYRKITELNVDISKTLKEANKLLEEIKNEKSTDRG